MNVTDSTIADNSAFFLGGGVFNATNGIVTIKNTTLSGNKTLIGQDGFGGGIEDSTGTVNLTNCTLSGNMARGPGGAIANGDTMTITNCTITGNIADSSNPAFQHGGGIYTGTVGTVSVKSSIIAFN